MTTNSNYGTTEPSGHSARDGRSVNGESAPNPDRIAIIAAHAASRHAHHEAGHAVAAVARGGILQEIVLGTADWTRLDEGADTPGWTKHVTALVNQPFVTYAGPWAEAKWTGENEPGGEDIFEELLHNAWDNNTDGDTAKYERTVERLEDMAKALGLGEVGRYWEFHWRDELEYLWPVICEIATALVHGEAVSHDMVAETIGRRPE